MSIHELICKLPGPTLVTIDMQTKYPHLLPMRISVSNLQYAFYWWKEATEDLNKILGTGGVEQEGQDIPNNMVTPSLIGPVEHIEYLEKELTSLAEECEHFLVEAVLPETVDYKVKQGYNNIKLALFNTQISKVYYDAGAKLSK